MYDFTAFLKKACVFQIACLIFLVPVAGGTQDKSKIEIRLEDSRLSVDIQGASLIDVIAELKARTGIDFRYDSLPDESVHVKFDGLSLRKSIERLIPFSTVILRDGNSIGSVVILPTSPDSPATAETQIESSALGDNLLSAASSLPTQPRPVVAERYSPSPPPVSASVESSLPLVPQENYTSPPSVSIPVSKTPPEVAEEIKEAEQKKSYAGSITFSGGGSEETQPLNNGSTPTPDSGASPVVTEQTETPTPSVSVPVVTGGNVTPPPSVSASVAPAPPAVAPQSSPSSLSLTPEDLAAFGSVFSNAQSLVNVTAPFAVSFPPGNSKTGAPLSVVDINAIVSQAANSLNSTTMVIAVVDRQGTILGLFRKSGASTADRDAAVALARTAAFFSHRQAVLTSRTVRFISGEHFPPGIAFTPNGALFGIEQNNRGCDLNVTFNAGKSFPQSLAVAGGTCDSTTQTGCGLGSLTIPGSFPLYKGNDMVGGIGVFGIGPALTDDPQGGLRKLAIGYEAEEFAALQGAVGFEPPQFSGGGIFIDGIRLPGVVQTLLPLGFAADPGGFAGGTFDIGPTAGLAAGSTAVPSDFLVGPTAGSALTLAEVNTIVQQARNAANRTRAAIRLPFTEAARMVIAVGDVNGNILAVFRQSDSTIFSLDVAITKARNVAYFSGNSVAAQDQVGLPNGTAITNRTISFGAQRFFPAGIDFAAPGPFRNVFLNDAANPCSQGRQPVNANQSGIVFFPGSVPLFKNGVLVGGLGVSGDGVEQDDFVTALGAAGFEPPPGIRADQFKIDSVRMPYLKFPRNPTNLGR